LYRHRKEVELKKETMLERYQELAQVYDPLAGTLTGGKEVVRTLSQLEGCFHDEAAYCQALEEEDGLIYRVAAVEPADGPGDMHYGLGVLYPGKVGREYYLTKGHFHENREAAEVYIGLSGEGCMLLEDEQTGQSRLEPLGSGKVVYVPGYTAHRTINTGPEPLTYFGIYPADAGHDYGALAERNFRKVLIEENGKPVLKNRTEA
jgi:glucose-6-phosphate isomerase